MDNVTFHTTCSSQNTPSVKCDIVPYWTSSTVKTNLTLHALAIIVRTESFEWCRGLFPHQFFWNVSYLVQTVRCVVWALLSPVLNDGHPRLLQVLDTHCACVTQGCSFYAILFPSLPNTNYTSLSLELILMFAFYINVWVNTDEWFVCSLWENAATQTSHCAGFLTNDISLLNTATGCQKPRNK